MFAENKGRLVGHSARTPKWDDDDDDDDDDDTYVFFKEGSPGRTLCKDSKHGPKMVPEWSQNGPKLDLRNPTENHVDRFAGVNRDKPEQSVAQTHGNLRYTVRQFDK